MNNYTEMRDKFYEAFKNEIVPAVQPFEAERKNKFKLVIIILIVSPIIFIFCPFALVIAVASLYIIKKNFEHKVKQKIMPIVCKTLGDLEWQRGAHNHKELFINSKVVSYFEEEGYDDTFCGIYNDVLIDILEAKYWRGGYGKGRRVAFKGLIIKLQMDKSFNSHTIIKPRQILHFSPSKGLVYTKLDDMNFTKQYDIFTNNESNVRHLITPAFMETLKNIKRLFKAKKVTCVFYGNYLLIALKSKKDLFSLCSLLKPVYDEKQYLKMFEEILSIIKLIDHFKLDQKIGL